MLSLLAWGTPEAPEAERAAALQLVERLGGLPLALEMAGAKLRNLMTAEEYLASLDLPDGAGASDRERIRPLLLRTLSDLEPVDRMTFLALGVLPPPGATGEMVATAVEEAAPRVVRRLDRLVRHHLANWSPELGRYRLHPLLRAMARDLAASDSATWGRLHLGAARALQQIGEWVHAPIGTRTDLARERWLRARDVFDGLDAAPWEAGAPGGDHVAMAFVYADMFRGDRTPADRERFLSVAVKLSEGGDPWRQAQVLEARGDLRRFRSDLDGAASDYDHALGLFEKVESRLGQANVLKARGDLRRFRSDLDGAASDYDHALGLFEKVEDRLGQANVLQARGDLEQGRSRIDEARHWYQECLPLYREAQSRIGLGNVLAEIATIHALEGRREAAREAAREALDLALVASNRYAENLSRRVLDWAEAPEEEEPESA